MDTKTISIKSDFITLGQFLKFADIINNGGEAKTFLGNNQILVNNEEENRRGRKLRNNDKVIVNEVCYLICSLKK